jgi:hypothetical protein
MHQSSLHDPGNFFGVESVRSESDNAPESSNENRIRHAKRSSAMVIDSSDEDMYAIYCGTNCRDVSLVSNTTVVNLSPRPSATDTLILYTKPAKSGKKTFIDKVPYQLLFTADSAKKSQMTADVDEKGRATKLCFEIASWDNVCSGLTKRSKQNRQSAIDIKLKGGMSIIELEKMGPICSGNTFEVGRFWYSVNCFYGKNINVATASSSSSKTSSTAIQYGLQGKCLGCIASYNNIYNNPKNNPKNNLKMKLKRKIDIKSALQKKAQSLIDHKEFTEAVPPNVAFSLVLRVLKNGGFICIRNQDDIKWLLTPLTKEKQDEYLAWVIENNHYGFRTGVELVLFCDAGINMISFDRTNSDLKIDEIGQTIVADTYFYY